MFLKCPYCEHAVTGIKDIKYMGAHRYALIWCRSCGQKWRTSDDDSPINWQIPSKSVSSYNEF